MAAREFSFTSFQASNPTAPPPGDRLDGEFDRLAKTIAAQAPKPPARIGKNQLEPGLFDQIGTAILARVETLAAGLRAMLREASSLAVAAIAASRSAVTQNAQAQDAAQRSTAEAQAASVSALAAEQSAAQAEAFYTETGNAARDTAGDVATCQAYADVTYAWAEHMPDPIPPNILAVMGITGAHWSSRWWANQAALTAAGGPFAPLASPVFTGDPKAPTPIAADNDTSIATTAFVKAQNYAVYPAWTAGSLAFATSPAALGQDNANLFWDDANNALGVGTAAPLVVSAAPSLTVGNGTTDAYINANGVNAQVRFSSAGALKASLYSANVDGYKLNFYVNGAVRQTIDTTGNVGIGTTGPAGLLHVNGANSPNQVTITGGTNGIRMGAGGGTATIEGVDNTGITNYQPLMVGGSLIYFTNSNVEAMRITGGKVGIGTTGPGYKFHVVGPATAGTWNTSIAGGPAGTDSTTFMLVFTDASAGLGFIGGISRSGAGVAYGTSSDERLKTDIIDSKRGLDALLALKVADYKMGDTAQQGLLAQQVAEHYPEAVHVGGDDPGKEPWMIDYGRLTPLIIKGMQQQQAEIRELKRRLDAKQKQR